LLLSSCCKLEENLIEVTLTKTDSLSIQATIVIRDIVYQNTRFNDTTNIERANFYFKNGYEYAFNLRDLKSSSRFLFKDTLNGSVLSVVFIESKKRPFSCGNIESAILVNGVRQDFKALHKASL